MKDFNFFRLRVVLIILIIISILFFPKIYIASHIYYYSVKINKKLNEFYALKSENTSLRIKIEKLKFKNRLNISSF